MRLIFPFILLVFFASCGPTIPKRKEEKKLFYYPARQLPPEKPYVRLREVLPPDPLPSRNYVDKLGPPIAPIYQLKFNDAPLSEVAKRVGELFGYRHYCSSLISNVPLSYTGSGTRDELAQSIAKEAKITLMVDHQNKVVRLLRDKSEET